MAPCGLILGQSHKHRLIIPWQEAVEAAELIQHDRNCQYMIKYRATLSKKKKKKNLTHPAFSLNQLCPAGVFQKERQRHVLIKEQDGICSKDLQAMEARKMNEMS